MGYFGTPSIKKFKHKMIRKNSLKRLEAIRYFAAPKDRYEQAQLMDWFGRVEEADSSWLIPCSHTFIEPTNSQDLTELESSLNLELPEDVEAFYFESNGAELFKLKYKSAMLGDYEHARYSIFNIARLVGKNRAIYNSFRSQLRPTSKYWNITELNYLAFCSLPDGDYLAVSLDAKDRGSIFFLDHEYGFLPYGIESTHDAYEHVASSFDEWITILVDTYGERGIGTRWIPL